MYLLSQVPDQIFYRCTVCHRAMTSVVDRCPDHEEASVTVRLRAPTLMLVDSEYIADVSVGPSDPMS